MRDGRHDLVFKIVEDRLHGLGLLRPRVRQRIDEIAGLHIGQHRIAFRSAEIIRDPVHNLVAVPAEFLLSGTCFSLFVKNFLTHTATPLLERFS